MTNGPLDSAGAATDRFLDLDPATGAICNLRRDATGAEYMSDRPRRPPVTIDVRVDAQHHSLHASQVRVQKELDGWQVSFAGWSDGIASAALGVTLDVRADSAMRAKLTVLNADHSAVITKVGICLLEGVALRGDTPDTLVVPHGAGERIVDVHRGLEDIATHADRGAHGTSRVRKVDDGFSYDLNYAGPASMLWMHYSGCGEGVYLAAPDPDFRQSAFCVASRQDRGVDLGFAWPVYVDPDGSWTSPEMTVDPVGADWHRGADLYRSWFDHDFAVVQTPRRWRELNAMWLPFMKVMDGRIRYRFDDLPALAREMKSSGFDAIAPYGWSEGGFDTLDPHYFPDLELGGPGAMRRAYAELGCDAVGIMGYLNARLFNVRSEAFLSLGSPWSALTIEQTNVLETYGPPATPETFAVQCASVQQWLGLLADFGDELALMGVGLLYFDQVAAAAPVQCFAASHLHEPGTPGWNQGYRRLLAQTLTRLLDRDPSAAIAIEGCADAYAPYASVQSSPALLLTGSRHCFPEMFKYTFPEITIADIVCATVEPPDTMYAGFIPTVAISVARDHLIRALVVGSCMGALDQALDDSSWWPEAREMLLLRLTASPLIAAARFRDTVGIAHHSEGLVVGRYDLPEQCLLLAVGNPRNQGGATLTVETTHAHAWLLNVERQLTALPSHMAQPGQLCIELPHDSINWVVITPGAAAPVVAPRSQE